MKENEHTLLILQWVKLDSLTDKPVALKISLIYNWRGLTN